MFRRKLWSIGPFHHGKSSTTFEGHKLRYARELLSQITPIGTNLLEECVACVKTIEYEARKCYSEHINLSSDGFVEMMVIDGLFIIELFRKKANISKIERDDPIFDTVSVLKLLRHDLVLLENQLPMIFNGVSLNILALQFFHELLLPQVEEVVQKSLSGCEAKHLLDLLGKTFHNLPKLGNEKNNSWKSIPSATKLKRAGVRFVVGSTNGSFLDIKFKDGVMEIPPMMIKYETDMLMRNLIAYELSSVGKVTYYMTSYGFLMESLINSGEDVRILRKQGILKNHLSSDEVGALLFKEFCRKVPIANFNYSELCDQVNSYYETPWHRRVWRILRESLLACMWSKN
ncbi:hypothetical protein MKW98_000292 [Papaver atlanticum]|uniref:Uncharacterized protein n=1 Tax=Papaver atlanticum TaxID=357466 RepID=A0AAD4S197_9MAGN|nr:hypothetical protein MKW98_000292 [Papaver atlanticum]